MENRFEVTKKGDYTLISILIEKLDANISPAIKSELVLIAGNGERNMIIDLEKARYCDSSGLSAILVANRLCKNAKGKFILTGLQPTVERLVSISQLDTVLQITETLSQAEAKIGVVEN